MNVKRQCFGTHVEHENAMLQVDGAKKFKSMGKLLPTETKDAGSTGDVRVRTEVPCGNTSHMKAWGTREPQVGAALLRLEGAGWCRLGETPTPGQQGQARGRTLWTQKSSESVQMVTIKTSKKNNILLLPQVNC